ncbi:FkbM family methyltransferase [Myxococcota bacterium]|nr:FkbM family methyltransferase [Myxococcota bacterium]
MKIGERHIEIRTLLKKVVPFARILWGLRRLEEPLRYLSWYLKRGSPDQVQFKNGLRINFSSNAHDLITVAVVFLQKDYGAIDRQSVVIDIGANIGTFALYAAQCGAAKVFAVEPNKEAFDILCQNVAENRLGDVIYPVNCAISDVAGDVGIPKTSSPYNQIVEIGDNTNVCLADYDIIAADTLSNFMEERKIGKVDLLKLDCEGAEFSILPSLSDGTWEKILKVRMEYHMEPQALVELSREKNFDVVHWRKRTKTKGDLWLRNRAS